jgi:hypothetical protein
MVYDSNLATNWQSFNALKPLILTSHNVEDPDSSRLPVAFDDLGSVWLVPVGRTS